MNSEEERMLATISALITAVKFLLIVLEESSLATREVLVEHLREAANRVENPNVRDGWEDFIRMIERKEASAGPTWLRGVIAGGKLGEGDR